MNNLEVKALLDEGQTDLERVNKIIDDLGITSTITPYLTRYAIIKACGTIEIAFKATITDKCVYRSKKQVKRFLNRRVRENSANPSYENICGLLKDFDEKWLSAFKAALAARPDRQSLRDALQSLVDARNDFAHGGNPSASIGSVITYYRHARTIIEDLDGAISSV